MDWNIYSNGRTWEAVPYSEEREGWRLVAVIDDAAFDLARARELDRLHSVPHERRRGARVG